MAGVPFALSAMLSLPLRRVREARSMTSPNDSIASTPRRTGEGTDSAMNRVTVRDDDPILTGQLTCPSEGTA